MTLSNVGRTAPAMTIWRRQADEKWEQRQRAKQKQRDDDDAQEQVTV
jgi:hypothetical protein